MGKRQKPFKPGQGYTKEDWDAVRYNPEWTAEDFARAKPFAEVFPELAASMRRDRGPNKAPTKKLVRTNKSDDRWQRAVSQAAVFRTRRVARSSAITAFGSRFMIIR